MYSGLIFAIFNCSHTCVSYSPNTGWLHFGFSGGSLLMIVSDIDLSDLFRF